MWQVENLTSYGAESSWTRDKNGLHLWLVAVKATFDIAPDGALSLTDEQPPPQVAPEYWGDPGASSLRRDAEIVPPTGQTDVLVTGSAHAPGARPASTVSVSLRVADVEKTLIVHGPRVYYVSGHGVLSVSAAQPFTKHPLRYEDAFGGTDLTHADPRKHRYEARNPVGKGVATDPASLEHVPAHRIEYANGRAQPGPAGLGPIDCAWSPRRERAGTYDDAWEKRKKPLLPDDFNDLYHSSAPDDQRTRTALRGDELVVLENLTPEGVLRFTLPKIYLAFSTNIGARTEEHRSTLGAVLVDADARQLSMVWQTALPVPGKEVDYLDETVIREKAYV